MITVPTIPIFGGGDCYSSESYWDAVESTGVDGVMVARGALIKPWIFTEIKERREWDISSRERLEMIRKVCLVFVFTRGLLTKAATIVRRVWSEVRRRSLTRISEKLICMSSHFGSDTAGVNTTRRYLCEALSFQYRYIPIGLLERLPGRLNDRPPSYHGRDELGASSLFFESQRTDHSARQRNHVG